MEETHLSEDDIDEALVRRLPAGVLDRYLDWKNERGDAPDAVRERCKRALRFCRATPQHAQAASWLNMAETQLWVWRGSVCRHDDFHLLQKQI